MYRAMFAGMALALTLMGCLGSEITTTGEWRPVSAELGGRAFAVENFAGATLHLTPDSYEFAGDKGTYTVLSHATPTPMDIQGTAGPNAGRTILAIYALAGDELTVCYQLGTGERPSAFESPQGSNVLLVHYRRVGK